jgi:hypothetical protein
MDGMSIIGKRIASVRLCGAKDRIVFAFTDGTARAFGVEGDCCSTSWIEHLEAPNDIAGATLLSVEDSGQVGDDIEQDEQECDVVRVYNTRFRTDRGDVVLEFRNSSNGFYGGYLCDADVQAGDVAATEPR